MTTLPTISRPAARLTALALCLAGLAACGSHDSGKTATSANDAVAASDAAAASAAPAPAAPSAPAVAAAAGTTTLPIYPGAEKQAIPGGGKMAPGMCGHNVSLVSYRTTAPPTEVAKWYKDHVAGSVAIDFGGKQAPDSGDDAGITGMTMLEVMTADGADAVVVERMHVAGGSNMQAAAKALDMDKTDIGIEHFEPAFGSDFVQMMARAMSGDAASIAAAKAKLGASCAQTN